MKYNIIYWITSLATILPIIILPMPLWLSCVLTFVIFLLTGFLPIISTIVETAFWVCGIMFILNKPFSFITILCFILFAIWLISTVIFFYFIYNKPKNNISFSSKQNTSTNIAIKDEEENFPIKNKSEIPTVDKKKNNISTYPAYLCMNDTLEQTTRKVYEYITDDYENQSLLIAAISFALTTYSYDSMDVMHSNKQCLLETMIFSIAVSEHLYFHYVSISTSLFYYQIEALKIVSIMLDCDEDSIKNLFYARLNEYSKTYSLDNFIEEAESILFSNLVYSFKFFKNLPNSYISSTSLEYDENILLMKQIENTSRLLGSFILGDDIWRIGNL